METLQALLGSELDSARLGAARAILDQAFRGIEVLDLAERIEQLEQALATYDGCLVVVSHDRRFNISFTLAGIGTFSNLFGAFGGQQSR